MKRLLVIAGVLIGAMLLASPAMAFDPPPQDSTANATDVILWYSDNLTIASANVSIVDFGASLTAAAEAGAEVIASALVSVIANIIALLLAIAITALAFWKERVFLYAIAVPVDLTFGLSFAANSTVGSAYWVQGIIVAVLGTSMLFKAAVDMWQKRRKGE